MSKPKYSTELKIQTCEDFLSGRYSAAQVCEKYGITYNGKNHSSSSLSEWAAKYRAIGWLSTKDGPGNRVVVYMQGCPVQCPWCHSPHSRYDISPLFFQKRLCRLCGKCEAVCPNQVHKVTPTEHFIDRDKCIHCGKCISACPYSTVAASNSVLSMPTVRQETGELFELLRPQLDLDRKSGGITLSGGGPAAG